MFVRNSKFRHVEGKPYKSDLCFNGLKTEGTGDTNCAVSGEFFAMIKTSKIYIIKLTAPGRQEENSMLYLDAKHKILDVAWSPFNDNILASCDDHGDINIWTIPEGGLTSTLDGDHGLLPKEHQRKATFVSWHPSADNVLATGGTDSHIVVWNTLTGEAISKINVGDPPTTMCWNRDGSLMAILTKTNGKISLQVIEPRQNILVAENPECYMGAKPVKVMYMPTGNILTIGSDRSANRSIVLWKGDDISKQLDSLELGSASNVLNTYYDPDLSILYTFGKGDGVVNYYEIKDDQIFHLNQYASSASLKGGNFMPKRSVDAKKNEIARLYKLHQGKCEPISFIVPRKSEQFQDDIFPSCASAVPAMTVDEWVAGQNAEPCRCEFREILGLDASKIDRSGSKTKPLEHKLTIPQKKPTPSLAQVSSTGGGAGERINQHEQQQSHNNGVPPGVDFYELLEDMKKVKATVRKLNRRVTKLEEMLEHQEMGEGQQQCEEE